MTNNELIDKGYEIHHIDVLAPECKLLESVGFQLLLIREIGKNKIRITYPCRSFDRTFDVDGFNAKGVIEKVMWLGFYYHDY